MATRKPISIDGEVRTVSTSETLADLLPPEVHTIVTDDGQLIERERFARVPVPPGFESNLTQINKGAGEDAT